MLTFPCIQNQLSKSNRRWANSMCDEITGSSVHQATARMWSGSEYQGYLWFWCWGSIWGREEVFVRRDGTESWFLLFLGFTLVKVQVTLKSRKGIFRKRKHIFVFKLWILVVSSCGLVLFLVYQSVLHVHETWIKPLVQIHVWTKNMCESDSRVKSRVNHGSCCACLEDVEANGGNWRLIPHTKSFCSECFQWFSQCEDLCLISPGLFWLSKTKQGLNCFCFFAYQFCSCFSSVISCSPPAENCVW